LTLRALQRPRPDPPPTGKEKKGEPSLPPASAEVVEIERTTVEGIGCATLFGVEVVAEPTGKDTSGAVSTIVECCITPRSAILMGVPTKPSSLVGAQGEAGSPVDDEIHWSVVVSSTGSVAIGQDQTAALALAVLSDSWEKAAPGRSAKGKGLREAFLATDAEETNQGAEPTRDSSAIAAADPKLLNVAEQQVLQHTLAEEVASLVAQREAAVETRKVMREVRAGALEQLVLSAQKVRAGLKQEQQVAQAVAGELMAHHAPPPPPPPEPEEKKGGKKGKK